MSFLKFSSEIVLACFSRVQRLESVEVYAQRKPSPRMSKKGSKKKVQNGVLAESQNLVPNLYTQQFVNKS